MHRGMGPDDTRLSDRVVPQVEGVDLSNAYRADLGATYLWY